MPIPTQFKSRDVPPVFYTVTQTSAPRGAGLPSVCAASPSACNLGTSHPYAFQSQCGQLATCLSLSVLCSDSVWVTSYARETWASIPLVTPHAATPDALEPSRAWHTFSAVYRVSEPCLPPQLLQTLSPQQ